MHIYTRAFAIAVFLMAIGCADTTWVHDPGSNQWVSRTGLSDWEKFTFWMDTKIKSESLGQMPPTPDSEGRKGPTPKTWQEYWERWFSDWRKAEEWEHQHLESKDWRTDAKRRIAYIKQRRLQVGLLDYAWAE
jgi:hypothetical protein